MRSARAELARYLHDKLGVTGMLRAYDWADKIIALGEPAYDRPQRTPAHLLRTVAKRALGDIRAAAVGYECGDFLGAVAGREPARRLHALADVVEALSITKDTEH